MATLATSGLLVWVVRDASQDYKLATALLVLSIWPAMVNFVSAQANVATEELSTNMPGSIIAILAFCMGIAATVILNWGVVGVGASMLLMRVVDFLVRFFPTMKRILGWDTTHVQPEGLSKRMMSFAWQSVASMVVAMIVWDRSELILLRHLSSDIRQVAFYSVAFSMAERLLIGSAVFGSAATATIFAQYGRDKSRLSAITASSFRYLALTSIPLHVISVALAAPALLLALRQPVQGSSSGCNPGSAAVPAQSVHRPGPEPAAKCRAAKLCDCCHSARGLG